MIPMSNMYKGDSLIKQIMVDNKFTKRQILSTQKVGCMQTQSYGRLGFLSFKDMNVALLSKLGWNMAIDSNKMWAQILKSIVT